MVNDIPVCNWRSTAGFSTSPNDPLVAWSGLKKPYAHPNAASLPAPNLFAVLHGVVVSVMGPVCVWTAGRLKPDRSRFRICSSAPVCGTLLRYLCPSKLVVQCCLLGMAVSPTTRPPGRDHKAGPRLMVRFAATAATFGFPCRWCTMTPEYGKPRSLPRLLLRIFVPFFFVSGPARVWRSRRARRRACHVGQEQSCLARDSLRQVLPGWLSQPGRTTTAFAFVFDASRSLLYRTLFPRVFDCVRRTAGCVHVKGLAGSAGITVVLEVVCSITEGCWATRVTRGGVQILSRFSIRPPFFCGEQINCVCPSWF